MKTRQNQLQNGSAQAVGASYSGLYEEGEVEHINEAESSHKRDCTKVHYFSLFPTCMYYRGQIVGGGGGGTLFGS